MIKFIKTIDVTNLFIAKGGNFLLVAVIFWFSSKNMSAKEYADFGYWWSVAIMIGGILFGGLSSSLIRVLSIRNSLAHLVNFAKTRNILLLASSIIIIINLTYYYYDWNNIITLLATLMLFGISIQLQTLVLALFRAVIATRANTISSIASIFFIPLILWLMMPSKDQNLQWLFLSLATAFFLNTLLICVTYKEILLTMLTGQINIFGRDPLFSSSIISFTAINIYTYLMLNIDFTIFKYLQPEENFTIMATGKIFFERFMLPFLLVFAGAASLSILRHRDNDSLVDNIRKLKITPSYTLIIIIIWISSIAGYLWFETVVRIESKLMPIFELSLLALGYLIYSINAVLFDLVVIRRGFRLILIYIATFIVLHFFLQSIAIYYFNLIGWVISWLLLNMIIFSTLIFDSLNHNHLFKKINDI